MSEKEFDKYTDYLTRFLKNFKDIYKKDIEKLQDENKELRDRVEELQKKLSLISAQNGPFSAETRTKNDNKHILALFNKWAAMPEQILPNKFCYIQGNMRIRTKQEIKMVNRETEWITNTGSGEKYLFPNPVFLNDRTDISELYQGNMEKLALRGNRIEILEPCKVLDSGYIEFPGKLRIL